MTDGVAVGVVANAAAGRDVRRLTTGASVVDNAEKGSMVLRLMAGLAAAGVDRVLMMPAGSGVSGSLLRRLDGHRSPLPELEWLELAPTETAADTVEAVCLMRERGVGAIAVLGGDGTNRVVARHAGDTPMCALSTGTNNAFPELREATVAGLATGLVATGAVGPDVLRREKILRVERRPAAGGSELQSRNDVALVDVATCGRRWTGARAIWSVDDIAEIVVAFASPSAVGLSAIAAGVEPVARDAPHGLYVRPVRPEEAECVVRVPLAPGLVVPIGIAEARRIEPGEEVELAPSGSVALDGERELELRQGERVAVSLGRGPLRIDVDAAMAAAARGHLLLA